MTEKFVNSQAAAGLSDTVLDADYVAGVDTEFVVTELPPDVALQGPNFRVKVDNVIYLITDLGIDDLHWTCEAVENTVDTNHVTGTPVYLEFTRGAIKTRLEDRTYFTVEDETEYFPNSVQLGAIPDALADLTVDVDTVTTPPTDGQALLWIDADGKWEPGDIPTPITELDDIPDVAASSPSVGDVLTFNGTNWVNDAPTGGSGGCCKLVVTGEVGPVLVTNEDSTNFVYTE